MGNVIKHYIETMCILFGKGKLQVVDEWSIVLKTDSSINTNRNNY